MPLSSPIEGAIYELPGPLPGTARLVESGKAEEQLLEIPGIEKVASRRIGFDGIWLPYSLLELGKKKALLIDYLPERHETAPSGLRLHKYQRRAVTFLRSIHKDNEGAILAGDPGLGKTIIVLHTLWLSNLLKYPGLVIGPNIAKPTWCDEDSDAFRHYSLKLRPLQGVKNIDPKILNEWPWFYCHYEILHAWQAWLVYALKPRWIICDESHFLANQKSQCSEAAREITKAISIERRFALTGTPIPNTRLELWAQLSLVQPRQWGRSRHTFGVRYCGGILLPQEEGGHWSYEDESNTTELRARLAGTLLRFTRYEVEESEVPDMQRFVIEAKLNDQRLMNEYSLAQTNVKEYMRQKKKGEISEQDVVLKIGNKSVKLNSSISETNAALKCYSALISILANMKREPALKETISILQKHKNVVVFTWHTSLAKWLHKKLSAMTPFVEEITGRKGVKVFGPADRDMPIEKRKALAVDFAKSEAGIYIATLASVGVSINALSAAEAGLMTELSWNTVRLIQGENRIQREGCPWAKVFIYYLVCRNTIDDIFLRTLQEKVDTISSITPHDVGGDYLIRDLSPTCIDDARYHAALPTLLDDAELDKDFV